jgi:uncharacterized protein YbaR (Trm112 family)
MASWMLSCPECNGEFKYSEIEPGKLIDFYLPMKPAFPKEGTLVECPHCKKSSLTYQHQLFYKAQ